MSIYNINNPIALTESDADAFLRDMDITLYEDTIMIEGTEYEGAYGEAILESNGIFLYEDGIVLEGKQADEYKARKAKEAADAEKAYDERNQPTRYRYGTTKGNKYPGYNNHYYKDKNRKEKADEMIARTHDRHYSDYKNHSKNAQDAIHRAHVFQSRLVDLERNTPYNKRGNSAYQAKEKRYEDTANKHYSRFLDAHDKANKSFDQSQKTYDNDVYRSTMRHLKNQDRIARSRKSTVQHNSTIFSDIEII